VDLIDVQWEEYQEWYCKHGYFKGIECPDCDCNSPVEVLSNRDPGDETDYKED